MLRYCLAFDNVEGMPSTISLILSRISAIRCEAYLLLTVSVQLPLLLRVMVSCIRTPRTSVRPPQRTERYWDPVGSSFSHDWKLSLLSANRRSRVRQKPLKPLDVSTSRSWEIRCWTERTSSQVCSAHRSISILPYRLASAL